MKRKIDLLLLIFCLTIFNTVSATDTLHFRETQIPLLIDRTDNILFQIRIDAMDEEELNSLTMRFGSDTDCRDIKAVKLYYSGTESIQEEGKMRFAPVAYISRNQAGNTREANSSYSIKLAEVAKPNQEVTFPCRKQLYQGINFFWISIELDSSTSLTKKIEAEIISAIVNDRSIALKSHSPAGIAHRLGIGVRHAGDDGAAAYRIPGVVTTNKGTLIGVYDVRYNNSADLQEYIEIGISRSIDKGQTWEPMRIAMSFGESNGFPKAQNGVGDPAILVDRLTGRIWVIAAWTQGMGNSRAWHNSQQGMDNKTAQLMLVYSDDDGQKWSEPINITKQVKDPTWHFLLQGPGMGITMQDGTLVFAAQYIDADKIPNACIIYSKDRGTTWHLHTHARTNTTEAQVAEIEPGVLMLNMRDNRGGSRAVGITKDLGKTWIEHPSSRKTLQEPVCMASVIISRADENVLGKDILLFSNPDTTNGRNHITIKASLDGGLTFPKEYQIMLDEEDSWGYSCLTMIDHETVGILYESSTAHMLFQAIPLKDFIKPNISVRRSY